MLLLEYSAVIVFFCSALTYLYAYKKRKEHTPRKSDLHLSLFAALLGVSYLLYIYEQGSVPLAWAGLSVDMVISALQVVNNYVILKNIKAGERYAETNRGANDRAFTRQSV